MGFAKTQCAGTVPDQCAASLDFSACFYGLFCCGSYRRSLRRSDNVLIGCCVVTNTRVIQRGRFVYRFRVVVWFIIETQVRLRGVVSVSNSRRNVSVSLCHLAVRPGRLSQRDALSVSGRYRRVPTPGGQLERLDTASRRPWPGRRATDRLFARVEAVVERGVASTPPHCTADGTTEMLTEIAVDEHVKGRIGDDQEVAESSVEEEGVRTSEKAFVHRAVQRLVSYTTLFHQNGSTEKI